MVERMVFFGVSSRRELSGTVGDFASSRGDPPSISDRMELELELEELLDRGLGEIAAGICRP
jgi:hypothetical protein